MDGSNSIKASPLDSGIPCRRHSCSKCCLNTRMPVTDRDLQRILKLGYEKEEFTVEVHGELRLRNKDGRCVFLGENGCRIYPFRPEGCRIYPLIYDEDLGRPVLDKLCPYTEEFRISKSDKERLRILLKKLESSIE